MRPLSHHQLICIFVCAFLIGCSSNLTQSRKTTNLTSDTEFRPQQNRSHYVIYYSNALGVHEFNSRTNTDNIIFSFPSNSSERQRKVSPDNTKIALTYINNYSEETILAILDLVSLKSWHIKKIPKNYYYSFEWSPDSKQLGVGYFSYKDDGYKLHEGDIFIASYDGSTINSIGCKVSKYFNHWLPNGILVVGDDNHLYGVNQQNCSTLFSLSKTDKSKVTFTPDGTKIFYFKNVPNYQETGGKRNMTELYIANYDGRNQKNIIGYKYDPRNASWSPDSKRIVCDVRSLEWTDVRHVAIYDLVTGKASFSTEEDNLGIPLSEEAFWSPDGNKLVYDKMYELLYDRSICNHTYRSGSNSYFVQHKILYNLLINVREVILEGSIHQNNLLTQPVGETVFWIDNQNILFGSAQGFKIFNLLRKSEYTFSPDKHPILIKQLSK